MLETQTRYAQGFLLRLDADRSQPTPQPAPRLTRQPRVLAGGSGQGCVEVGGDPARLCSGSGLLCPGRFTSHVRSDLSSQPPLPSELTGSHTCKTRVWTRAMYWMLVNGVPTPELDPGCRPAGTWRLFPGYVVRVNGYQVSAHARTSMQCISPPIKSHLNFSRVSPRLCLKSWKGSYVTQTDSSPHDCSSWMETSLSLFAKSRARKMLDLRTRFLLPLLNNQHRSPTRVIFNSSVRTGRRVC